MARRGRGRSPRRARRLRRLLGAPRLPALDQRQLDVLGLGLVALAAFSTTVFYLGLTGGEVGEAMVDGTLFLFGGAGYLAPIALFAAGALLVLRPILPPVRPLKAGAACLTAALLLGLAAGWVSLGPGRAPREGFLDASYLRHHGGAVGEVLLWTARTLFQEVGAQILFLFLLVAGLLLLTGGTVAGFAHAARRGVASTTRRMHRSARASRLAPTASYGGEHGDAAATRRDEPEPPAPDPEPPEAEPVVRATHVEAPALDAAERYPDIYRVERPERGPPEPDDGRDAAGVPSTGAGDQDDEEPDEGAEPLPEELTPQGMRRSSVTEADDFTYALPGSAFLRRSDGAQKLDGKGIARVGGQLVEALGHFLVEAEVIGTVTGPHVTRYELRLAPGIKMSKVAQLKDDLAYALAAEHVRILAPIPGKQAVGVEVPNGVRRIVHLGDVFQEAPAGWSPLTVWLGKDIAGKAIGTDLAKQPHVLVAGATGSGKSGCINAMLSSILLCSTPNDVRMVLVDPKRVELNHYEGIPHLLTPVVTNPRLAANVLGNLIREMEERYSLMSAVRTRSLVELNRLRARSGKRPLPHVLCVIDELADLMMVAPAEVEDSVIRLAQKSRAVGIHLVLATQRPSADVITGLIKANVPARIAFAVSSQTDSRVILDQNGAESLLGQGDMLFRPASESRAARIQGAFVSEEEIERLTEHWRRQGEPELREELLEAVEEEPGSGGEGDLDRDRDELLPDAIETVVGLGTASTSMLQRRLRIGYTRAGRLIDMMERRGVISGYEGSKARQVLITEADLSRVLESLSDPVTTTEGS